MGDKKGEPIPITSLDLQQLGQVKQQLSEEIEEIENKCRYLSTAIFRFNQSKKALETCKPENKGKEMLVPVTASLYVKGNLQDTENVLVDIGTNYFADMSIAEATAYCDRKNKMLGEKLDQLKEVLETKEKQLQGIIQVMQNKIREIASEASKQNRN